jgi:hypothetical protein
LTQLTASVGENGLSFGEGQPAEVDPLNLHPLVDAPGMDPEIHDH